RLCPMQLRPTLRVVRVLWVFIGWSIILVAIICPMTIAQAEDEHVRHVAFLHDLLGLEDRAVMVDRLENHRNDGFIQRSHVIADASGVAARPGVETNFIGDLNHALSPSIKPAETSAW